MGTSCESVKVTLNAGLVLGVFTALLYFSSIFVRDLSTGVSRPCRLKVYVVRGGKKRRQNRYDSHVKRQQKKKSSAANQVPHDQKCEWKSVYGWKFPAFNSGRNISTYHSHKCLQWETTVNKAIKKTTKKKAPSQDREWLSVATTVWLA